MAYNPVDVELLKDRVDIVDTIGRHVELKKSGSNWVGLCPFHKEKTPSFNVSPSRNMWKCYGCNEGGDVISFLMKIRNLTFLEVIEELADENGISLKLTGDASGALKRKSGIYSLLEAVQEFFAASFTGPGGREARAYLEKRGINENLLRIGIGYAPGGNTLLSHLRSRGYSVSAMEEAGVVRSGTDRHYDRFRNRLTFPIHDRRGRIVSFGARALDDSNPKYLNGPETDVYSKGSFLYGYARAQKHARAQGRVILVEGYFDHARLLACGFGETVATSGTALTEKQARNLTGMADSVLICYDGDGAGSKAAVKAAETVLSQKGYPRLIKLPPGCDPDDFVRENGPDQFEKLLENPLDPISFCISLMNGRPLEGAARSRTARRMLQVASAATDPLVEEDLRRKVEEYTGYSRTALLKASEDLRPGKAPLRRQHPDELSPGDRAVLRAATAGGRLDRDLIRFLHPGDMSSPMGEAILKELRRQLDMGYSTLVFGELEDSISGLCADISGSLDSVTSNDVQRLKRTIEKNRREKPRRRELISRLQNAGPGERAVILEELNDFGGFHDR